MITLHFAGEKAFSEQLKRRGFCAADIQKIVNALFEVSRIDSCVVELAVG